MKMSQTLIKYKHKPSDSASRRRMHMVRDSHLLSTSTITGLILSLMIGFSFVVPAYATDSITITIDDSTLDLNLAPTNATGTFAKSNKSMVSVTTTNGTGYTLGIRADGTNPDKLISSEDTTKVLTSVSSATTESQFKSLAGTSYNGMWGYLPSKYCTSNSNTTCTTNTDFLPAPTTTGDILDVTSTANPTTANTYTLSLGARVDSTQKLGSYSNTYVIYADANAIPYSIVYDDNVVSNMPSDVNSGQATGGQLNIASNTPTRSGYKFLGWCTVATSDPASSTSDCTTAGGTFYSPNQSVTIASATNFHLYAMWKETTNYCKGSSYDCLQEVTTATCPTTAKDVIDGRDGNVYKVQKLADNKCWMLDNLRLDPTAVDLDTLQGKTNASDQTLTYFKNGGGSSPYTGTAVANKTSGFTQYDTPDVNVNFKDNTTTSYGSGSGKVGVYYNYCAASAGSYCYSSSSSSGNASEDICPAGWRMPTGGSSGEYQALYTAYSSNATNFRNALSTPLSGTFYSSSQSGLGSNGYFWSSTRRSNTYMYYLNVDSSNVNPQGSLNRFRGYSVRCVAK